MLENLIYSAYTKEGETLPPDSILLRFVVIMDFIN